MREKNLETLRQPPYRDGYPFPYLGECSTQIVGDIKIGAIILWAAQASKRQHKGMVVGIMPPHSVPYLVFPEARLFESQSRESYQLRLLIERNGEHHLIKPWHVTKVIGHEELQPKIKEFSIKVSVRTYEG